MLPLQPEGSFLYVAKNVIQTMISDLSHSEFHVKGRATSLNTGTANLNFANKDAVILKDIAAIWKSLQHTRPQNTKI